SLSFLMASYPSLAFCTPKPAPESASANMVRSVLESSTTRIWGLSCIHPILVKPGRGCKRFARRRCGATDARMLSIPIVARLLGGNGQSKKAQESFETEVKKAAFRIDPAARYYLLSDFHLEPDAPAEHAGLLKLLGRLLSEGGIGGVFLLGDLAARPGIRY